MITTLLTPATERFDARPAPHELPDGTIRHLAVAASELAREAGLSAGDRARYAGVEAHFRDLTDAPRSGSIPAAAPVVQSVGGQARRLTDLVGGPLARKTRGFPPRQIDRRLVEEVKDLLRGLAWTLPGGVA